jgi:hypothetical protein
MRVFASAIVVIASLAAAPVFAESPRTVTITAAAPVFLSPSENQSPLRVAKEGSVLLFLDADGEWYHIEFNDPQFGRRVGYVQKRFGRLSEAEQSTVPSADLSVQDSRTQSSAVHSQPVTRPGVDHYASDLFAGYSVMHDGESGLTLPMGWIVSVAGRVNKSVAIVGEANGGYRSVDLGRLNIVSTSVHNFVAGPRFYIPAGNASVFTEVLGGLALAHGSYFGIVGNTTSGLMLLPGGGVDIPVSRALSVRVGANVATYRFDGEWGTGFRFNMGAKIAFGNRN